MQYMIPIFVVLLILKLAGVIAWSWWIVFIPILLPTGIVLAFALFCGVLGLIAHAIGGR